MSGWKCIDKENFHAPRDSRSVFLGFSEITECEKEGLVCPLGAVCNRQKDSGYTCACKDGYEVIYPAEGKSKCQGIKISDNLELDSKTESIEII